MRKLDAEKISLNMPNKLMRALRWLAKKQNRPYSDIIREGVKAHVVKEVGKYGNSSLGK